MPVPDASTQALKQRFQCLIPILINTAAESTRYVTSLARSRSVLAVENLFLRKQLAFYQERQARPGVNA
jgi:hypothetical protein